MANAGQQVPRCAYPGCKNEPRPGQGGPSVEPGYCGLPDPVTGEPHTALTAFRQRQVLAGQGGQAAGPEDQGRPGFAVWRNRRAGAQRRQRAEAEAAEARSAALQADARLAEALAAKAAAEQEAATARQAARDQAELRAAFEAQIAAAENARAALQARAERAEAELQRALADRDQAPEKAAPTQPPGPARRRRRPPQS